MTARFLADLQAGRSQSPHPATRSPREGLLVRLDDEAPLHSEPTTIQEANSRVGSPEVNLLLPPSTGGVEAIVEAVDEDGKPTAEQQHGTPVKTPSPLGEHGDGTENVNGSETSEDAKAADTTAESSKDASKSDTTDASKVDAKDVSKGDAKDTKDTGVNGNSDKTNGKGHNEPKRGRNKKKGKK